MQGLLALLQSTAGGLLGLLNTDSAASIATATKTVATLGDAKKVLSTIQAFKASDFAKVIQEKGANLTDDAVLADDVLADLAPFIPEASEIEALVKIGEAAAPFIELLAENATPAEPSFVNSDDPEQYSRAR